MRWIFVLLVLTAIFALRARRTDAEELPPGKRFTNSIGMDFVRIEPGSFRMGAGETPLPEDLVNKSGMVNGGFDEYPRREVTISQSFFMGAYEVTNAQYEEFDPHHALLRGKWGFSKEDDEAVVFVDWHEAKRFCEWLSRKEGLPYRLPTEAEWEYACRAGTQTHFSTGDAPDSHLLTYAGESWFPMEAPFKKRELPPNLKGPISLRAGQCAANPWGLHDMHGNVEEWCHDWYGPYDPEDVKDPVGRADGDARVTRGGSHSTEIYYLRSAARSGNVPEDKHWLLGFRVVLGHLPATQPLPPPPPERHQTDVRPGVPADIEAGPSPDAPYFEGPRVYVKVPPDADGSNGPLNAHHNHDTGLAQCPNGDLLAIWYSCKRERERELCVAASRLRWGAGEWDEASVFWDVPKRNDHAPALWFDGDRTVYHFQGLSVAATWGGLATLMRTSTDSGATWSRPLIIMPEHAPRQMPIESIFRMQNGDLVLPCDAVSAYGGGTALWRSPDNGRTWRDAGGTIQGIHAGVVQLADGRLLALGRALIPEENVDGRMPMSISNDGGATWEVSASPFPPVKSSQRIAMLRLQEGPIFVASFATVAPATITDASGKQREIEGLFAALSYDEGETWSVRRPISDDAPPHEVGTMDNQPFTMTPSAGEPKGYLSVCQARNGVIHLISSRNHYAFNLAWLEAAPPALE